MPALGTHARRGLSAPARVAVDAAGMAAGRAFEAVSRLRGAKSLHPYGAVYEGTVRIRGGVDGIPADSLLGRPAEYHALVRISRSLGLPESLPDLMGIALRLPDVHGPGRHQDLLMVTSVDAPLLHHVFLPVRDPRRRPYSSSLPYRIGDRLWLIGARARGEQRFDLLVAPMMGFFAPVGELELGARLPDELEGTRFNPWNTGGGLEPATFLNRLRDYAYPLSQAGWRGGR